MRSEDGQIIRECLDGDSASFGLLVDKYKASIYALAYSRLHNFHDAEDIAQEVFLKAYKNLHSLRRWDSFLVWIRSIAINLCKNKIRMQARRPDSEPMEDQEKLEKASADLYRDEQSFAAHHETLESLNEALESLPEIYQQVLTLHYLGKMSGQQMSQFLGISHATVRQRLSRARRQLREEVIAMMSSAYEQQRLQAGFTFRVVEAVKHIKINPTPRMAGVPLGLSLAAGIIIAVLSLNPHLRLNPASFPASLPLPVEANLLETGEIPVDVLMGSQPLTIPGKHEAIAEAALFAPTKAASEDGVIIFGIDGVIYIMDADGRNKKQLTSHGRENGLDGSVSLSPDGKQIAFARNFAGIYIMNVDGSNVKQLTKDPSHRRSTWSPDGKQIAFEASIGENNGGIYAINADGSNLRKLVEGPWEAFYPAFSPDGSKIAFSCTRANNSADIYVIDADGANMERLTSNNVFIGGISWSPDGTEIAFGRMHNVTNIEIYVMDADGKNQANLTNTPGIAEISPSWSRDGRNITFTSDRGGNLDIYVMNADGSNVQQITNTPKNEREPVWTVSLLPVDPAGKLPTMWGEVKQR